MNWTIPSEAWLIFIVGHIGITIWWASKVNTTMDSLKLGVNDVVKELKEVKNVIFTRSDAMRELQIADKVHDELKERIEKVEERHGELEKVVLKG